MESELTPGVSMRIHPEENDQTLSQASATDGASALSTQLSLSSRSLGDYYAATLAYRTDTAGLSLPRFLDDNRELTRPIELAKLSEPRQPRELRKPNGAGPGDATELLPAPAPEADKAPKPAKPGDNRDVPRPVPAPEGDNGPRPVPPPGDNVRLPQGLGLMERSSQPPSRWIDQNYIDLPTGPNTRLRAFGDGMQMQIEGNPPQRVTLSNGRQYELDAQGNITKASYRTPDGQIMEMPDCVGGKLDQFGAVHLADGRVICQKGGVVRNEDQYIHGLRDGFSDRLVSMVPQGYIGTFNRTFGQAMQGQYHNPFARWGFDPYRNPGHWNRGRMQQQQQWRPGRIV